MGEWVGGDFAPRSMVSSTMNSILVSIPGLRRFNAFWDSTIFDHATISDRSRFALRACGIRRPLRRSCYISAPCIWGQGSSWDPIRMGSGRVDIKRETSKGLFCFPQNIARNVFIYRMENSTAADSEDLHIFCFFSS